MKLMMPKQLKKVKKFREKIPLFFKENIEKKLFEIFKTEVKLKFWWLSCYKSNRSFSFY